MQMQVQAWYVHHGGYYVWNVNKFMVSTLQITNMLQNTSREVVETLFCTQTQQKIASVSPHPPKCHHTYTPIAPVSQPRSKLQMSRQVNSLPLFSLFLIIGVQFVDNKRKRSQVTVHSLCPLLFTSFSFSFFSFVPSDHDQRRGLQHTTFNFSKSKKLHVYLFWGFISLGKHNWLGRTQSIS